MEFCFNSSPDINPDIMSGLMSAYMLKQSNYFNISLRYVDSINTSYLYKRAESY